MTVAEKYARRGNRRDQEKSLKAGISLKEAASDFFKLIEGKKYFKFRMLMKVIMMQIKKYI